MKKHFLIIIMLLANYVVKAQNNTYKVYAIRFAASAYPFTVADWATGGSKTDSVKINFMVWLIKGSNGKNILVDAGFLKDIEDAKDFKIVNYTRPDSALLKADVKAEDITDVILTHPHWDHIDGISLFANAHFWIQKEDYNYFVGQAWQKKQSNGGFDKRDVQKIVNLNLGGKVTLIDGDNQEIIPGIKVYTGARHTYNSQYILVQTGTNKIVLASDNVWVYYSLDHLVPASPGGTLDPAGQVKAIQRMKTMVSSTKYIIPGHDAQVFSRFTKTADGVVVIK